MKIAVILDDGSVYVEFDPQTFRELLKTYTQSLTIDQALDKIIADLKQQTLYK